MRFSKSQMKVLHIFWSADTSLSIKEIANRAKYRFAGNFIASYIVEDLLEKGAVFQSGIYSSYSQKHENVIAYFSPQIQFDEYYARMFEDIAPQNIFRLLEKLLRSDKLSFQMLCNLSEILSERLQRM